MKDFNEQIKIGKISSVDAGNRTARVILDDEMVSGELHIVQSKEEWLPSVGQWVLCAFPSAGAGDGFIMGAF